MKSGLFIFFIFLFIYNVGIGIAFSQELNDTTAQSVGELKEEVQELPQIQLQEYTIIGLAKVFLPHKIRKQIFKDVEINWVVNSHILEKEPPSISFQFSRIKPSFFQLYEFPWFNTKLHYGSFNTMGINFNTQFKARDILPYLSADYQRSDGHEKNAQWSSIGLQAGIHHKPNDGHLFHVGTNYIFQTKGIWGDYDIYQQDWETQTVFWKFFGKLEQEWNKVLHTEVNGSYFLDDHENAFQYKDRGFDFSGRVAVYVNNTAFETIATFRTIDLSVEDANLTRLPADSTSLEKYVSSVFTGSLNINQKINVLKVKAGVVYQQAEEDITTSFVKKVKDNFVYPDAALSLGFLGKGNVYVRYRPAVEAFRFRNKIRLLPFVDLSNIRLVKYNSRIEGGIDLNPVRTLTLNFSLSSSRAEDFPASTAPADSLNADFNNGGYPGWVMGTLDEVQIQELYGRIDWYILPQLRLLGWANFRQSEIRKSDSLYQDVKGNEIPYYPKISAYAKIAWNFFDAHEASVFVNYKSKRYDDLLNSIPLKDYFLLNARLDIAIKKNIKFFIIGENLLDTKYEEWRGFPARAITGMLGLEFKL